MAEYIDREMAINLFYTVDQENNGTDGSTEIRKTANYSSEEIESMLSDLPPADVTPVRHGRWLLNGRCSECLENPLTTHKTYCPHCGAIMDGGYDNAAD